MSTVSNLDNSYLSRDGSSLGRGDDSRELIDGGMRPNGQMGPISAVVPPTVSEGSWGLGRAVEWVSENKGMILIGVVALITIPLFAIGAIVFAIIGMGNVDKNPNELMGKGFAIGGLVFGILEMLIFLLILLVAIAIILR